MRRGNLFVISGPSGSGKGTLVGRLMAEVSDAWLSVSMTTRAPREGEVEGVNYYYKTRDEFMAAVAEGDLLEWAEYSGNCYGTPKSKVLEHVEEGLQVVLEIETQGAFQVREMIPQAHLVFVAPPSMEELERRLRNRGTDSEEAIELRLKTAVHEMTLQDQYDKVIVNDDLDTAVAELVAYVNELADR